MKTETKQLRVRQNRHCIRTAILRQNHPCNTLDANVVQPNPTKSSYKIKPPSPALHLLTLNLPPSVFISVHPWLRLDENKNFQTNPFVIFQFAPKSSGIWPSVPSARKKRTHSESATQLSRLAFGLRSERMSRGIFHLGTLIPEP